MCLHLLSQLQMVILIIVLLLQEVLQFGMVWPLMRVTLSLYFQFSLSWLSLPILRYELILWVVASTVKLTLSFWQKSMTSDGPSFLVGTVVASRLLLSIAFVQHTIWIYYYQKVGNFYWLILMLLVRVSLIVSGIQSWSWLLLIHIGPVCLQNCDALIYYTVMLVW